MGKLASFDLFFLHQFPENAATVLEGLAPADVAETLALSLDDESQDAIGAVVEKLSPAFAAQCLEVMPAAASARLLDHLDDATATAVLRNAEEPTRKALLGGVSQSRATALDRRLKFAAGTVGAFMEGAMTTFRPATQVSTCLTRLKKSREDAQSMIILADTKNQFVGAVTLSRLVVSDDKLKLRDLVTSALQPLQQNMPIDAAADSPAWAQHAALPVVNADGEIVGELTHERLIAALTGANAIENLMPPVSIIANLGHAYLLSLRGFASLGDPNPNTSRRTGNE